MTVHDGGGEGNVLSAEDWGVVEAALVRDAACLYAEAQMLGVPDTKSRVALDAFHSLRRRSDEARKALAIARELCDLTAEDAARAIENMLEPVDDYERDVRRASELLLALNDALVPFPYDPLSGPDVPESALLSDVDVKGDRMAEAEADR